MPVTATAYVVSPPVTLRQTGTWPGLSLVRSQRVFVSHGLETPPYAPVVVTTAYVPSGAMSRSRMYVSNEREQPGAKNVVDHVDSTDVAPEVFSRNSSERGSPSTVEKLPRPRIRLPSGVASILFTVSVPPLSGPANVCCRKVVSLPVVGSREAICPRVCPPTVVNAPAMISWPCTSRMSWMLEFGTAALKAVTFAPVLTFSLVILRVVTPLTVLK